VHDGAQETTETLARRVPAFPDRLRLPLAFDPGALMRDLTRLNGVAWTRHFVEQNYSGDWSAIPLRSPAGETHPVRMIYPDPTARTFEDGPLLTETPYFREVLGCFAAPLRCVRLMRLTPGSVIKTHDDFDLDFESGSVRIHIPITTNPDVEFLLNGAPLAMAPGEAWYLRLSDPHSAANRGASDRVHLVIDADANDWLGELFRKAA
jgi:hypothetical protein